MNRFNRLEDNRVKKRKKKVIIVFLFLFSFILSLVFLFTYIYNSPINASDFPIIRIKCDKKIASNKYLNCTFEMQGNEEFDSVDQLNAKIKLGGRLNAKMPKKPYRIELSNPISLAGMREDDDWHLFALYMDLTRMRIKLAMDLWNALYTTDQTAILPHSEYVLLYLNGEFLGLYLLAEKNDRRLFGLDDTTANENSSLIIQSDSHDLNFHDYYSNGWDQDWPNEYEGIYIKNSILQDLVNFIGLTSDDIFFNKTNGIFTRFDKLNLIDFFVFNFFLLHKDFWSHNYFLVRNTAPNKFFLIPWDFDSSFGQFLGIKYSPEEDLEPEIFKRNFLFFRLMNNPDFMSDAKERWLNLRDTILSEESILDRLTEIYDKIKDAIEVDTNKWYHSDEDANWSLKVDEAIDYLYNWIPDRLEYCDFYFLKF